MNYTTVEQSKKLVELGLNLDTANMHYPDYYFDGNATGPCNTPYKEQIENLFHVYINPKTKRFLPCWSLGALLELMPPYLFDWRRGIDLNIYRNLNGKGWHVSYIPNNIEFLEKDKFRQITNGKTPIEAVYNMVCWLLENNYIKTEKK